MGVISAGLSRLTQPATCVVVGEARLSPSSFGYFSTDGGVYAGSDAPGETCTPFAVGEHLPLNPAQW